MTISLSGTTGIITPAEVVNGDETVTGNLNVTGNTTITGTLTANGGGIIKSGTLISTATTTFTGATTGSSINLTAISPTGTIQIGQVIVGTNIAAGTSIIAQQSGTTGGAGVYTLSQASAGTVSGAITVVGVDFYGIPSTAKRVTVMFSGVSTTGTAIPIIQLGSSSGIENSTYTGYGNSFVSTGAVLNVVTSTANTIGFNLSSTITAAGSSALDGTATLVNLSGNSWVINSFNNQGNASVGTSTGTKTIALGALNRIRFTTFNGTDTFDAGSINILYE